MDFIRITSVNPVIGVTGFKSFKCVLDIWFVYSEMMSVADPHMPNWHHEVSIKLIE